MGGVASGGLCTRSLRTCRDTPCGFHRFEFELSHRFDVPDGVIAMTVGGSRMYIGLVNSAASHSCQVVVWSEKTIDLEANPVPRFHGHELPRGGFRQRVQ